VTEAGSSAPAEPEQAMPAPDAAKAEPEASHLEPPPVGDPLPPLPDRRVGDTGLQADQVPPLRAFDPFAAPPAEEAIVQEPQPHPDRAEPEPPAPRPERLEIVSSPIELVMGEHDETGENEAEPRPAHDPPAAQA